MMYLFERIIIFVPDFAQESEPETIPSLNKWHKSSFNCYNPLRILDIMTAIVRHQNK